MNNQNRVIAINMGLSLIGPLVRLVESLFGQGTGADKKAAVTEIATGVIATGLGLVGAHNPAYQPVVDLVGQTIENEVAKMKFAANASAPTPPAPEPAPTPAPTPTPAP